MKIKRYKIILHSQVKKEIKSLPKKYQETIIEIIENLKTNPIPQTAIKLKGRSGCYRIQFGTYRIIYEVNVTEIVIYVLSIVHRKEVYRQILKRQN